MSDLADAGPSKSRPDIDSLEGITRQLLVLVERLTGMESAYLTWIDPERQHQKIMYVRNSGPLDLPEGLTVPWEDTLCRLSLEEGRCMTSDVPATWPESSAARALGLKSYISVPVQLRDGVLFGTLCGASTRTVEANPDVVELMELLAALIARQAESEANIRELSSQALSDPLTGLPNRRSLVQSMELAISAARCDGGQILAAFIDLDGFKRINDQHGHEAGDLFLISIARRLQNGLRSDDVVARIGGDEFVVITTASAARDPATIARHLSDRIDQATIGEHELGSARIDYPGASIGVVKWEGETVSELLKRADQAMYLIKRQRRGPGDHVRKE